MINQTDIQALVNKANEQRRQAYENQAVGLIAAIQGQLDWVKSQNDGARRQAETNIASYRAQLAALVPPTPITVDLIMGN